MAPVVQADPLTAGRGPASLNAATFKIWLDNNAVGYIAIGKRSLHPNAEYKLVSAGELGYLSKIWANTDWTLFGVADPTPIVPASARITDADQSNMTIEVSHPGTVPIRVRWSKFLAADGPQHSPGVTLRGDGYGWTILTAPLAGLYVPQG
jgi:hypothetical protein